MAMKTKYDFVSLEELVFENSTIFTSATILPKKKQEMF